MQTSTSVTRQIPYEREVVGPRPLTTAQAIDLLYLMALLKRWDRVLEACGGDREHALRVWREVGRAELAADRRVEPNAGLLSAQTGTFEAGA